MPIEILMPALSPTMKEGNLARWLKKEGDQVKAGEIIAEIETDKATMEVEAVDEGVLGKILVKEGTENVAVNSPIALLLEEGEDKSALEKHKGAAPAKDVAKPADQAKKDESASLLKSEALSAPKSSSEKSAPSFSLADQERIKASPLAKRIAADKNADLKSIIGTGPRGRIVKDDVMEFAAKGGGQRTGEIKRNPEEARYIKNNNIRKVIARRLLESKQTVPHFYLSCDLKIDRLLELKDLLTQEGENYKVSVNDLVIKAAAMALKKVPNANSSWTDDAIVLYNNVDVSVAVAIPDGLITPVIRNADQKSIFAISSEMRTLAKKARDGKLQPEEFQGGGFSISNLGMFGIDNFSAIINPPQSCILAVGRGVKKPIIEHDKIATATMMNATISCDHRVVDGAVGAEFLKALRKYIENPALMFV